MQGSDIGAKTVYLFQAFLCYMPGTRKHQRLCSPCQLPSKPAVLEGYCWLCWKVWNYQVRDKDGFLLKAIAASTVQHLHGFLSQSRQATWLGYTSCSARVEPWAQGSQFFYDGEWSCLTFASVGDIIFITWNGKQTSPLFLRGTLGLFSKALAVQTLLKR